LAPTNVLSCLRAVCVRIAHNKLLRLLTERRTPIPANTTVAGENACKN
jgi:hypothetical protein